MRIWMVLLTAAVLFAGDAAAKEEGGGLLVALGNSTCPIMGKEVAGKAHVDWNGLRIELCCPGCAKKVLADPEKALDEAGIEWREAADLVAKANGAKGEARKKLLATIANRWKIVGGADTAGKAVAKEFVVDLGNKKCPIMGGKVDGKSFTVWNGLRIGHCCPGCTGKLLEDPAEALDKAGIEWRTAAKFAAKLANARPEARKALLASAGASFRVVEVEAGPVVDLANGKCPVMGGETKADVYTVWNGLRIRHCCPGCKGRLLASPEKVLDKAGIDWREAAKAVAKVRNASGEKRAELLAKLEKDYTVVGE